MASSACEYRQGAPTKRPVLTAGDVSPEQLHKWEMGCRQYFVCKGIPADQQVQRAAWRLLDPCIQQRYIAECARLDRLDFATFVKALRAHWLLSEWILDLRRDMLSSRQGSRPLHEWVIGVQTKNSILMRDVGHMSDQSPRYHLEAHMNKGLAIEYRLSDARNEDDLCKWIEKVKKLELDEKRIDEVRILRERIDLFSRPKSRLDQRAPEDPRLRSRASTSASVIQFSAFTGRRTAAPSAGFLWKP